MKFRLLFMAVTLIAATSVGSGQDLEVIDQEKPVQPGLVFDNNAGRSPSDLVSPQATAKQLRIARAQYRERQRLARLERNLWLGYEPLRPRWNAVPMMTSRYAPRRIYVPVYVTP